VSYLTDFISFFAVIREAITRKFAKSVTATSSVIANNDDSRWLRLLHCGATDPGCARANPSEQ
jgi:hypothetical protein